MEVDAIVASLRESTGKTKLQYAKRLVEATAQIGDQPQHGQQHEASLDAVLEELKEGKPQLETGVDHDIRMSLLDVLHRTPLMQPLAGRAQELAKMIMELLYKDNEFVAGKCLQILFQLYKAFPNVLEPMCEAFMEFFYSVFNGFEKTIRIQFQDQQRPVCAFVPSMQSFTVLSECPLPVLLMFQMFTNVYDKYHKEFIRLMIAVFTIPPPIDYPQTPHMQSVYETFVSTQVKIALSTTYLFKVNRSTSTAALVSRKTVICDGVMKLFENCPHVSIDPRRELLTAFRSMCNSELRSGFLPHIDAILHEEVLIGNFKGTSKELRPLAFLAVSELVLFLRDQLQMEQTSAAVSLFSRGIHDTNLSIASQLASIRALQGLVDHIYKSRDQSGVGHMMLLRIMNCLTLKMEEVDREVELMYSQMNVDKDTCVMNTEAKRCVELRSCISDILSRFQTLVWCVVHSVKYLRHKQGVDTTIKNVLDRASETSIMERFLLSTMRSLRIFQLQDSQPNKAPVESFAQAFTFLELRTFKDIFIPNIGHIFRFMVAHPKLALVGVFNAFFVNANLSFAFSDIAVEYFVENMETLAFVDSNEAATLLSIFRSAIGTLSIHRDNEASIRLYLNQIISACLAKRNSNETPTLYLETLKILFKGLGGGKFDLLYREVLPLLPELIHGLLELSESPKKPIRETAVLLCLTIPARLSSLLPFISEICHILCLALHTDSDPLLRLGLKTLEFYLDLLEPEFLNPILSEYLDELLDGLYRHIEKENLKETIRFSVLKVIGKLGGQAQDRIHRFELERTQKGVHAPLPLLIPLAGESHVQIRDCCRIINHCIVSIRDNSMPERKRVQLSLLLVQLLSYFDADRFDGEDMRESDHSGGSDLPLELFERVMDTIMQVLNQCTTTNDANVLMEFLCECVEHYANEAFQSKSVDRGVIFIRAMIQASLGSGKATPLSPLLNRFLATWNEEYDTFGIQKCVFEMQSLCFEHNVSCKGAATAALKLTFDVCALSQFHNMFESVLRALVASVSVHRQLTPMHWDTVVSLTERLLAECIQAQSENTSLLDTCFSVLAGSLISPFEHVRSLTIHGIRFVSDRTNQPFATLVGAYKSKILAPVARPLYGYPTRTKIGYIHAITVYIEASGTLEDLSPQLKDLIADCIMECNDSESSTQGLPSTSEGTTLELRITGLSFLSAVLSSNTMKKRDSEFARFQDRIIKLFFNCLPSRDDRIVSIAKRGLEEHTDSIPKELLKFCLRPILQSLSDNRKLSLRLLKLLAHLLQLLSQNFNEALGDRLLHHLSTYIGSLKQALENMDASSSSASQKASHSKSPSKRDLSKQVSIPLAILNLFHLLPAFSQGVLPKMVSSVLKLEDMSGHIGALSGKLTETGDTQFVSPFRKPLFLFLAKREQHVLDFFFDLRSLIDRRSNMLFVSFLSSSFAESTRMLLLQQHELILQRCFSTHAHVSSLDQFEVEYVGVKIVACLAKHTSDILVNEAIRNGVVSLYGKALREYASGKQSSFCVDNSILIYKSLDIMMAYMKLYPDDLAIAWEMLQCFEHTLPSDFFHVRQFYKSLLVTLFQDEERATSLLQSFCDTYLVHSFNTGNNLLRSMRAFENIFIPYISMKAVEKPHTSPSFQRMLQSLLDVCTSEMTRLCCNDGYVLEVVLQVFDCILDCFAEAAKDKSDSIEAFLSHFLNSGSYTVPSNNLMYTLCHFMGISNLPFEKTLFVFSLLIDCKYCEKSILTAYSVIVPRLSQLAREGSACSNEVAMHDPHSDLPTWIQIVVRKLESDRQSMSKLLRLFQVIRKEASHFEPHKAVLIPFLLGALDRLGLPGTRTSEFRQLSIDLSSLVLEWTTPPAEPEKQLRSSKRRKSSSATHHITSNPSLDLMRQDSIDTLFRFLVQFIFVAPTPECSELIETALTHIGVIMDRWSKTILDIPFVTALSAKHGENPRIKIGLWFRFLHILLNKGNHALLDPIFSIASKLIETLLTASDDVQSDSLTVFMKDGMKKCELLEKPKSETCVSIVTKLAHGVFRSFVESEKNVSRVIVALNIMLNVIEEADAHVEISLMAQCVSKLAKLTTTGVDGTNPNGIPTLIKGVEWLFSKSNLFQQDETHYMTVLVRFLISSANTEELINLSLRSLEFCFGIAMFSESDMLNCFSDINTRFDAFGRHVDVLFRLCSNYVSLDRLPNERSDRLVHMFRAAHRVLFHALASSNEGIRREAVAVFQDLGCSSPLHRLFPFLNMNTVCLQFMPLDWFSLALELALSCPSATLARTEQQQGGRASRSGRSRQKRSQTSLDKMVVVEEEMPSAAVYILQASQHDSELAYTTWNAAVVSFLSDSEEASMITDNVLQYIGTISKDKSNRSKEVRLVAQRLLRTLYQAQLFNSSHLGRLRGLVQQHELWHEARLITEDIASREHVDEVLYLGILTDVYKALNEEDVLCGVVRQSNAPLGIKAVISLHQFRLWGRARDVLLQSIENTDGHDGELNLSEYELELYQEEWIRCMQNMNKWDLVEEYGSTMKNTGVLLDCYMKTGQYEKIGSIISSEPAVSSVDSSVYTLVSTVVNKESNDDCIEDAFRGAYNAIIDQWSRTSSKTSLAHGPLMEQCQTIIELREGWKMMKHASIRTSSTPPDLTTSLEMWRRRLPPLWKDLPVWKQLVSWRLHVFESLKSITAITDQSCDYSLVSDTPWTVVRLAEVAREQLMPTVALDILNDPNVAKYATLSSKDAFAKWREMLESMCQNTSELRLSLSLIQRTNIDYFDNAQKAEVFRQKADVLQQLGFGDEANAAFSAATSVSESYSKSWASWGSFCDRVFSMKKDPQWAEFAVSCYLHAVAHDSSKARLMLARVLWLLSFDESKGPIMQTFEKFSLCIPLWNWIRWIPQLLSCLSRNEATHTHAILLELIKLYPQSTYNAIRSYVIEKRDTVKQQQPDIAQSGGRVSSHTLGEHLIKALQASHPALITETERMMDEIIRRLKPEPDEELLGAINTIFIRSFRQPVASPDAVPASLSATIERVHHKFFVRPLQSNPGSSHQHFLDKFKSKFEEDLLPSSSTFPRHLTELMRRLKWWKNSLEAANEHSTIRLHTLSQYLATFSGSNIEIPGQYIGCNDEPYEGQHVLLEYFSSEVTVHPSHGFSPRRITMYGNDGKPYSYLVQYSLSHLMRAEERLVQLHTILNQLLSNYIESDRRKLHFGVYKTIPLTNRLRLVESHADNVSLEKVFIDCFRAQGKDIDAPLTMYRNHIGSVLHGDRGRKAKYAIVEEIQSTMVDKNMLSLFMEGKVDSAEQLWQFRKRFGAQLALTSFLSYVLKIGDRVPYKISFSTRTATIHNTEMYPHYNSNNVIESSDVVPFRLTPNLQHFLSPPILHGVFNTSFLCLAACLLKHTDVLKNYLYLFFREDIVSFSTSNMAALKDSELRSLESRFRESISYNTLDVLQRIQSIMPSSHEKSKPISYKVDELIEEATDLKNLSAMSPVWHPWL